MWLFLDDERVPSDPQGWTIARSSDKAIRLCRETGLDKIDRLSLDHDLGGTDTAMIFLKWLIEADLDQTHGRLPDWMRVRVHSQNSVGAENLRSYLRSYWELHRTTPLWIE